MIRVDRTNTVKSLRDKLQELVNAGNSDSGFPILRPDEEGMRMVGYIGANELEHALSEFPSPFRSAPPPTPSHPTSYIFATHRGGERRLADIDCFHRHRRR